MKIKPKHKNKTLAIFATLFLTLTLIVTFSPVSSNIVQADVSPSSYYAPNIPFSMVEYINVSTNNYSSVALPTLYSYTADNEIHINHSDSTTQFSIDLEMNTSSAVNNHSLYGQYSIGFILDGEIRPELNFIASNFILSPYTHDFKYSYLNYFPYVYFYNNASQEERLANTLDFSIDFCSFMNYTGGAYESVHYSYSRTFDYEDDAEYYEILDEIMDELQSMAYTTYNSSSPIYVLELELTLSGYDHNYGFDSADEIYCTFGDSFTEHGYYLKSYDLFTSTYFNANYEFSWFESIVNSVNGFLQIEFLPDFSFGDLLFCVIAIPLAIWLLKLWLGG